MVLQFVDACTPNKLKALGVRALTLLSTRALPHARARSEARTPHATAQQWCSKIIQLSRAHARMPVLHASARLYPALGRRRAGFLPHRILTAPYTPVRTSLLHLLLCKPCSPPTCCRRNISCLRFSYLRPPLSPQAPQTVHNTQYCSAATAIATAAVAAAATATATVTAAATATATSPPLLPLQATAGSAVLHPLLHGHASTSPHQ